MDVFDCVLRTFLREIFARKIVGIEFDSLYEGRIGIFRGHEDMDFLLSPGIVDVQMKETRRKFYSGSGFCQVRGGSVHILAFPLILPTEKVADYYPNDNYAINCEKIWQSKEKEMA